MCILPLISVGRKITVALPDQLMAGGRGIREAISGFGIDPRGTTGYSSTVRLRNSCHVCGRHFDGPSSMGQSEMKTCAARGVVGSPQAAAMGFEYRAADPKSHSGTAT